MLNENEVHDEVLEDGDITPDEFRALMGEISQMTSEEVTNLGAEYIYKQYHNLEVPEVVKMAVSAIHRECHNPTQISDNLTELNGLSASIMTLYIIADAQYRKEIASVYPEKFAHGGADRGKALVEAQTADIRSLKNFSRNLFYLLTRASSSAQSQLKMETVTAGMEQ